MTIDPSGATLGTEIPAESPPAEQTPSVTDNASPEIQVSDPGSVEVVPEIQSEPDPLRSAQDAATAYRKQFEAAQAEKAALEAQYGDMKSQYDAYAMALPQIREAMDAGEQAQYQLRVKEQEVAEYQRRLSAWEQSGETGEPPALGDMPDFDAQVAREKAQAERDAMLSNLPNLITASIQSVFSEQQQAFQRHKEAQETEAKKLAWSTELKTALAARKLPPQSEQYIAELLTLQAERDGFSNPVQNALRNLPFAAVPPPTPPMPPSAPASSARPAPETPDDYAELDCDDLIAMAGGGDRWSSH